MSLYPEMSVPLLLRVLLSSIFQYLLPVVGMAMKSPVLYHYKKEVKDTVRRDEIVKFVERHEQQKTRNTNKYIIN